MKKQILTDNETKAFLMKVFKCSRQAVWLALNFMRDSDQARRIRQLALQRGGKLTEGYTPNCETTHDEVNKTMDLAFGPRVKVVCNKLTGDASVLVDGQLKESRRIKEVPEFMLFLSEAELMASAL